MRLVGRQGHFIFVGSFYSLLCADKTIRGEYPMVHLIKRDECHVTGSQMDGYWVGLGNLERLGHCTMRQPANSPTTYRTLSDPYSGWDSWVEHATIRLTLGLLLFNLRWLIHSNALNIREMSKSCV